MRLVWLSCKDRGVELFSFLLFSSYLVSTTIEPEVGLVFGESSSSGEERAAEDSFGRVEEEGGVLGVMNGADEREEERMEGRGAERGETSCLLSNVISFKTCFHSPFHAQEKRVAQKR